MLAAFLTAALFAMSTVFGHRSARQIGGTEANFWRIATASSILAIWGYTFGKGLSGPAMPMFMLSGIVGIGFGDVAYFQALPRLGPRLCLLLVQCLTAPLGALIEWLWLGTTLSVAQLLCGILILAGVAIALMPSGSGQPRKHELGKGILAGILASLGGAGGAVFSRKAYEVVHATGAEIDPVSAGFQRVLGGLLLSGLFLWWVKRRQRRSRGTLSASPLPQNNRRGVWVWILLNGLAGQTIGVSCMQWALETTPAGIVLPIIATSPILVIPITYTFEGERPPARSLIGGVIAVCGVIALTMSR